MDAIYYNDTHKLSQINLDAISEVLEDAFSYYLNRYKKNEEDYYVNKRKSRFDYRGFRELLI